MRTVRVQDGSPFGLEEMAESSLVVASAGLAAAAQKHLLCGYVCKRRGDRWPRVVENDT